MSSNKVTKLALNVGHLLHPRENLGFEDGLKLRNKAKPTGNLDHQCPVRMTNYDVCKKILKLLFLQ